MNKFTKMQQMRADFISYIKSVVFTKGEHNICGGWEIKFDKISNVIFLNYFDINGESHSSYIESILLDNDKLSFNIKGGDVLSPSDLEMEVLANIVDRMEKISTVIKYRTKAS